MKRTLFLFIMTLLPLVTATTFTSCGDDDEIVILHVPAGSVDAYKAVEPWNQFANIVAIE